ncbi:GNAT family N-acetyltransferase [Congregibacter brevis]|uniref:GNAT family N-acetyltransferase n=1 Tax=Congregibacter brevis TaxID=3081201 RepID=A0ABZ0IGZ6_9GAMM|nr:GNAT family N-acetyltransferase [Congregibacter sp. IMCC45268]
MLDESGWSFQPFSALSGADVYDLLQLRSAVFVVEQDCVYLDPDGLDQAGWHCCYRKDGRLLAYQRCLPPGTPYGEDSSMGRIIVDPSARGSQLGRELVRRGIEFNLATWPKSPILIGAQAQLQRFYESMGFVVCSEPYLEDGIPHLQMQHPNVEGVVNDLESESTRD